MGPGHRPEGSLGAGGVKRDSFAGCDCCPFRSLAGKSLVLVLILCPETATSVLALVAVSPGCLWLPGSEDGWARGCGGMTGTGEGTGTLGVWVICGRRQCLTGVTGGESHRSRTQELEIGGCVGELGGSDA